MYPDRKIVRLRHYDYRLNGAYFITICTLQRRCAFSRIENGGVRLHPFGKIAEECWLAIPKHFKEVELDEYVIMPNHVHGILFLGGGLGHEPENTQARTFSAPEAGSLSVIMGSYKSAVSREIGKARGQKTNVWQRGFHDHVIRDDDELDRIREYIRGNPGKWEDDEHFPRD